MMTSEGKSQRTFPPREGARNARFFKGQFSSATLFSGATATTGARVRTRATSQPQSPVRQFGDELDLLRVKASLKPCIDLVSAQTFSHSLFVMSYAPLRKLVAFTAAVKFESKLTACSHRLALFSTVARLLRAFHCGL